MDSSRFWDEIFERGGPVEIEVGCGDGAFLLAVARRHPERNFLGFERSPAKARRLAERVERSRAPNVRTLQADAACVVTSMLPDASVAAYHVYFPDPWPKRHHARRRIFTPSFVAGMARTLVADGPLFFVTDVERYAGVARACVLSDGSFAEVAVNGDHPGLETSFARKYRAAGRPLYPYVFLREPAAAARPSAASNTRST